MTKPNHARTLGVLIFGLVFATLIFADAQPDTPVGLTAAQIAGQRPELAPLIAEARRTLPAAKDRFRRGLAAGYAFYVVTRLYDTNGRFEQIFIRVRNVEPDKSTGTIASHLALIKGAKAGDAITVADANIIDWLITDPNGNEEGNLLGKWQDAHSK